MFSRRTLPTGQINSTNETTAPKKINSAFVIKSLKSAKFKEDLVRFINERFVVESAREASKKLYKLVDAWQEMVLKKDLGQFEGVCRAIEHDRKTKLPWTLTEVSAAIDSFLNQFIN